MPRPSLSYEASQQVQPSHSNGRQRVGLMPSDGQDAYKRSSIKSSRRSRGERTSYLVATGHLNLEETEHLNKPSDHSVYSGHDNNISGPSSSNNDRGKFRQTYTEVPLPMKTSPAFEYILKDNKRRNKRCCLWLLYSTLITICIAIIVFCSVHLVLRYHNHW